LAAVSRGTNPPLIGKVANVAQWRMARVACHAVKHRLRNRRWFTQDCQTSLNDIRRSMQRAERRQFDLAFLSSMSGFLRE